MTESIHQINSRSDGSIYFGPNANWSAQNHIDSRQNERQRGEANARTAIDVSNENHEYPAVIELANDFFRDKGLAIEPIRVVSRNTYNSAYRLAGRTPESQAGDTEGEHAFGRAIVVRNPVMEKEFGDDFVLGIALHEAAHSLFQHDHMIRTTTETMPNITSIGGVAVGGLIKADFRERTEQKTIGYFWNEAFADLTRVRALRKLGRTHTIEKDSEPFTSQDGQRMVIVPNGKNEVRTTEIRVPAEFATCAKTTNGTNLIASAPPNFAAYALELLDQQAPGLYDDILASIDNPKRQAAAIRKIESVRHGLYRELSNLSYTEDSFMQGLGIVVRTIKDRASTNK